MANTKITAANIDSTSTGFTLADLTVDTTTLVVDASNNRVGIGTSSPSAKLDVSGVFQFFDDTTPEIKIVDSDDNNYALVGYSDGTMTLSSNHGNEAGGADVMLFLTGGSEKMRIDSSGNVGIGVSPSSEFHVKGDANTIARIEPNNNSGKATLLLSSTGSGDGGIQYDANSNLMHLFSYNYMTFNVGTGNLSGGYPANERMRIDSSGRLLVGTTSTTPAFGTNTGIALVPTGESMLSANSSTTLFLNRTTSDGAIVDFRKDGTQVGSIAVNSSTIQMGTNNTHLAFSDADDAFFVKNAAGANRDGSHDLGKSSARFKDLYLSSQALVQSGATTAPSFAFTNDTDTGISRPTSDTVNICTAGSERVRINSTGFFLQEGNIDYHNKVPEFSQSGIGSYSSSTNIAYAEGTIDVPGKGEKLVCQTHARGFTNYVHLKTNLTSDNIMFYFRTLGYCYNTGMEEHVYGGYTYNSTVIATEHQTVYGGTHALHAYRGSSGHLCLRIHVNSTGYNEGRLYVYFGGHSPSVTRELQITDARQRDDGNNAF